MEIKEPTNIGKLKSFLKMIIQLGIFIPRLAKKDKPYHNLLSKKNCWIRDVDQATSFKMLKKALPSPVLTMCGPNRDTNVVANASLFGLGSTRDTQLEKEALSL